VKINRPEEARIRIAAAAIITLKEVDIMKSFDL
jgi:hypothetical protein